MMRTTAADSPIKRTTVNVMENVFLFFGFVVLYFAMQLWILPKMGIQT